MSIVKNSYTRNFIFVLMVFSVIARMVLFEGIPFYVLAILFIIPFFLLNKKDLKIDNTVLAAAFITIIISLTTILFTSDRLNRTIQVLFLFEMFLVGYFFNNDNNQIIVNFKYIRNGMVIAAIYGLYEYFIKYNYFAYRYTLLSGTPERYDWQFSVAHYRDASFFLHPIIYGVLLLLAFWYTFFSRESILKKSLINILFLVNILFTMSRSVWISLVVSLLYVFLHKVSIDWFKIKSLLIKKSNFKKYLLIIIVILGMILFLISSHNVLTEVGLRFASIQNNDSYLQRSGTNKFFISSMFRPSGFIYFFLGHGHNSADDVMKGLTIIGQDFSTTDNQYISFLYNYGIIFSIIFLATIITKGFKCLFTNNNGRLFIFLTFLSFSISMFFFEILNFITLNWLFMFLWGYILRREENS